MKYKKLVSAMALGAAVTVGLAACGGKKDDGKKSGSTDKQEDVSQFPVEVSNKEEAKEGGTLEVAVVMDTQFAGLFQEEFYENNYDAQFMLPSHESIFVSDSNFETTENGLVKKDIDVEKKTIKLTITKDAKWSDGSAVTAKDFVYAWQRAVSPKTAPSYSILFVNSIKNANFRYKKSPSGRRFQNCNDYWPLDFTRPR